jgi:hypothetical protein
MRSARGSSPLPADRRGRRHRTLQLLEDRIPVGVRVHEAQQARGFVVTDQRLGLSLIHFETLGDDVFLVVGPLDQTRPRNALTAMSQGFLLRGIYVENTSATLAYPAARQSFEQNPQIEVEQQYRIERRTDLREHFLEGLGLHDVPRKAVQNEPLDGVRPS